MRVHQRVLSIFILALLVLTIVYPLGAAQSKAMLPAQEARTGYSDAVNAGWIRSVQENLRLAEYHITWQERTALREFSSAFQAPNRAHNLRVYFTPEGIRVIPRQAGVQSEWEWGLKFTRFGFEGQLRPVGKAADMTASGNRFEYQYQQALQEWYVNDTRGLKQGFTVETPPELRGTAPLVFELSLVGNLIPSLQADGQTVLFSSPDGVQVLCYSALKVFDAAGQQLPAFMRLIGENRALQIVVEAAGAVYPIIVDPLATSPSWAVESNQAGAQLGAAVASAGDVNADGYGDVIVAAPLYDTGNVDAGIAQIYLGSASGPGASAGWTIQGGSTGARLGQSVDGTGDINGDGFTDVIVGAPGAEAAYVFFGGNPMDTTPDWTGTGSSGDNYGFSVASAGDVNGDGYMDVIVGAYTAGVGGRAYVYHGSAGGVSATADWQAEAGQAGAQLGYSVSRAGDVNGNGYGDVLVGAPGFDAPNTNEGAIFLWYGWGSGVNGGTPGTPGNSDWNAEGEQNNARLGASVSWAGDVNGDGYGDVLAGASHFANGNTAEGGVFLWVGSSSGVNAGVSGTPANAAFSVEGNADNALLGSSVGMAGDANGDGYADVIYGAPGLNSASVHFGSTTGVQPVAAWTGTSAGNYGVAVNGAGDLNGDGYSDVVVGASLYESTGSQSDEGQVVVYFGGAYGLATSSAWRFTIAVSGTQVGSSVSTAGDVNGDGYDDVIVGAWIYDDGQSEEGAVFVFHGSATGLSSTWDWKAESNQNNARLGTYVSTAGDVNGDGYSDILVGARGYDNGQTDEGAAFVWYGSSSGLGPNGTPANADWMAESNQPNAWFGDVVAYAGDVNGDGYGDIMIGASRYDNPQVNEGAVFVWYGSINGLGPNGTPANASWRAESDQDYAGNSNVLIMGKMFDTAGDVNGDGYDDVFIGFYLYDKPQLEEGIALVFYGSANGLGTNGNPANADWLAEGDQTAAYLGAAGGTAGDVNGDGYSDVIVSATHYDRPEIGEGVVFAWYGSASGLNGGVFGNPANSSWSAESNVGGVFYGMMTGLAGDVNGDGYSDVYISTMYFDYGGVQNTGIVDVYHGSAAGLNPAYAWRATGNGAAENRFGNAVSMAGDVNGDGYSDLIVGEYNYSTPNAQQGRAYLFYGNGGSGYPLLPQQRRADNSAPIVDAGQSISPNQARLAALGRSPFGLGSVRLEWEIKPLGIVFNGSGLGQSAWSNSGLSGYAFNELISGLTFETKYHWRVRILGRPNNAPAASAVTYRSRWIYGERFFTALSGTQALAVGTTLLLGQSAYVDISAGQQGSLTSLALRGYPDTAHPQENFRGGGENMLNRYFSLSPNVGASGYSLRLCLNYNQNEVIGLNENLLRLCRWTGSSWTCPNRSAVSDTGANLVCADGVTQLSDWTIGQVGPTSVNLVEFRAVSGNFLSPAVRGLLIGGLAVCLLGLVWLGWRRKK